MLRANIGLAGTPDHATLALRLRFRTDRRRPITDAVLYARGGGNYDPITLDLSNGDDAALQQLAERIVAWVEALAGTPVPKPKR